jgi:hypothetical protein
MIEINSYTAVKRRERVPHEVFAHYWPDVHGPLCSRLQAPSSQACASSYVDQVDPVQFGVTFDQDLSMPAKSDRDGSITD